ncbi:MAG: hypothetical protein HFH14_09635 [Lachnospiraceae bacterium]|nr:hypothetical protein [Lachnospiraceae bacterium]
MKKKLTLLITIILLWVNISAMPSASRNREVVISEKTATLFLDETLELELENAPKNKTIIWQSSDEEIAAVSGNGKIKPEKCGKVMITAKLDKKKYICRVKVIKKNASDVKALKCLIKEQQKAGADVAKDINSFDYVWNENGRLTEIHWYLSELKGNLSFCSLPALEYICVGENNLTGLDVSRNENLQELECFDNKLKDLNLAGNPELKELSCDYNSLTRLDISRNRKLKAVTCVGNKLTCLHIGQNLKLKYLQCSKNQLTGLDVSKNTLLNGLWCKNNNIKKLNLKSNKKLDSLKCDKKVKVIR